MPPGEPGTRRDVPRVRPRHRGRGSCRSTGPFPITCSVASENAAPGRRELGLGGWGALLSPVSLPCPGLWHGGEWALRPDSARLSGCQGRGGCGWVLRVQAGGPTSRLSPHRERGAGALPGQARCSCPAPSASEPLVSEAALVFALPWTCRPFGFFSSFFFLKRKELPVFKQDR